MKTKTKINQSTLPIVETNGETCKKPGFLTGISVTVDINSITMDTEYTFTGMTSNGKLHYEIPIFTQRYGRSMSSVRRDIDELLPEQRPSFCVSVSKKHYVNEGILIRGKKKLTGWERISEAREVAIAKNRVGI